MTAFGMGWKRATLGIGALLGALCALSCDNDDVSRWPGLLVAWNRSAEPATATIGGVAYGLAPGTALIVETRLGPKAQTIEVAQGTFRQEESFVLDADIHTASLMSAMVVLDPDPVSATRSQAEGRWGSGGELGPGTTVFVLRNTRSETLAVGPVDSGNGQLLDPGGHLVWLVPEGRSEAMEVKAGEVTTVLTLAAPATESKGFAGYVGSLGGAPGAPVTLGLKVAEVVAR